MQGLIQFATKPKWGIDYLRHEKFRLPQLENHVDLGGGTTSIGDYFTSMLDQSMNWRDVAEMVQQWDGIFCLKGVMSVEDARRAVDVGCRGIVVSNHGGRQLDGSRSSFDQLAEIVDAVGDKIDVLFDGGVQRGTHVLKAISLGAKAVGMGRFYLFPLAAAGQPGVERALGLMRTEIERDMKLMGCTSVKQLSRSNLRIPQLDFLPVLPCSHAAKTMFALCQERHIYARYPCRVAAKSGGKPSFRVMNYRTAMSPLCPFIPQFQTQCCTAANYEKGPSATSTRHNN